MTFKECSEKYPIGMIMGNFLLDYTYPVPKEELQIQLRRSFFYPEFFYFYNKKDNNFRRADFLYHKVEGYITIDGVSFHPFSSDEMGIYYLDNSNYEEWIKFDSEADYENEIFSMKINEAWLNLHPELIPIRTKEELEAFNKYDF